MSFTEYGVAEIKTHFYQEAVDADQKEKAEELKCEWKKFKYNLLQLKNEIPQHILHPPQKRNLVSATPTEWALHQMLSQRATYEHFMPLLLYIAEVCLSLPVSNAWSERGASALKRLKTRLHNTLKNNMLEALNVAIIEAAVKKWLPKHKKLAKARKTLATDEAPTSADVVQASLVEEPEDTLVSGEESLTVSGSNIDTGCPEIDSVIAALNLPEQEDDSDSDVSIGFGESEFDLEFDSEPESENESDLELLW